MTRQPADEPQPDKPDTSHFRAQQKKTKRLPSYLLKHPHVRLTVKTVRVALPISAAILWMTAWWASPEYFDYGVLKSRTGGGSVRFGGMGWCGGENNCTLAPWYGLPKEYLPASLPTFLPALLTLFNLLGAPILLFWWIGRYISRPYRYWTAFRARRRHRSRNTDHLSNSVRPFEPYWWFRLSTPFLHYTVLGYSIISAVLTVSFFIGLTGETGWGVTMVWAGCGIFIGWQGIEWKFRDWGESARYIRAETDETVRAKEPVRREHMEV